MSEDWDEKSHTGSLDRSAGDSSEGPSTVPEGVLELDPVYDALAHPRRRYLCYTLLSEDEQSVADIAEKIAAWEADVPAAAVTEERKERVSLSLYHTHIPKLVEHDVVTLDSDDEIISTAENTEQVLSALESVGATLDSAQESHAQSVGNDE